MFPLASVHAWSCPPSPGACRRQSSGGGLGQAQFTNRDTPKSALAPEAWSPQALTFGDMSNPYAFEFSDGSKKYTLVCTVESPGVQPRFTLALTHGSSSWTSDSELHMCFENPK